MKKRKIRRRDRQSAKPQPKGLYAWLNSDTGWWFVSAAMVMMFWFASYGERAFVGKSARGRVLETTCVARRWDRAEVEVVKGEFAGKYEVDYNGLDNPFSPKIGESVMLKVGKDGRAWPWGEFVHIIPGISFCILLLGLFSVWADCGPKRVKPTEVVPEVEV